MFPPSNPIRVTLDDTANNRPISCKPQSRTAPVKILRRPSPTNSSGNINSAQPNYYNHVGPSKTHDLNSVQFPIRTLSGSNQNFAQTEPQLELNRSNNSNNRSIVDFRKTYQERANEYAKARLRILGSAFPDPNDDGDDDLEEEKEEEEEESDNSPISIATVDRLSDLELSKDLSRSLKDCPKMVKSNPKQLDSSYRDVLSNGGNSSNTNNDRNNFNKDNINWLS